MASDGCESDFLLFFSGRHSLARADRRADFTGSISMEASIHMTPLRRDELQQIDQIVFRNQLHDNCNVPGKFAVENPVSLVLDLMAGAHIHRRGHRPELESSCLADRRRYCHCLSPAS